MVLKFSEDTGSSESLDVSSRVVGTNALKLSLLLCSPSEGLVVK